LVLMGVVYAAPVNITRERLRRLLGWTVVVLVMAAFFVWVLSMSAGHAGS
jgi:hypothetical protein